ncbi:MAG: hypothetical protein ACYCUI_15755 [Vulcanimicrobiaceae bacterium]
MKKKGDKKKNNKRKSTSDGSEPPIKRKKTVSTFDILNIVKKIKKLYSFCCPCRLFQSKAPRKKKIKKTKNMD